MAKDSDVLAIPKEVTGFCFIQFSYTLFCQQSFKGSIRFCATYNRPIFQVIWHPSKSFICQFANSYLLN